MTAQGGTRKLQADKDLLATLLQIAQSMASACTQGELLQSLAAPAIATGACEAILLYLYPGDAPERAVVAAAWSADGDTPSVKAGEDILLSDIPLSCLWFCDTEMPQLIESPDQVLDGGAQEYMEAWNIEALASIPLFDAEAASWVGLLVFHWQEHHQFSSRETAVYESLPDLATPVVTARQWPRGLVLQVMYNAARLPTLYRVTITDGLEDSDRYVLAEDMEAAVHGVQMLSEDMADEDLYVTRAERLGRGVWMTPAVADFLLTHPVPPEDESEGDDGDEEWEDGGGLPPAWLGGWPDYQSN
jgi:hypothetical protein